MRRFPDDFVRRGGVYQPRDAGDLIDYTDGEPSEQRLREILGTAGDRSSDSAELRAAICDWPTRYHLAPERANLLRALDLDRRSRVLELGCGCGALTRYLGENVASVVAVEGSARRAALARMRCSDLENVEVVAGNFDDVAFPEGFDVVTLIGVLEYAALYTRAVDDPFEALLHAARRNLRPGGVLVLAIENALGVKYLAGCGEDHGLRRFSSVEGYPDGAGPRTFGRLELETLLGRCGFESRSLLLPFPDYKLPQVVLNAAHTSADDVRSLNLVDWCRQPYQQYDGERLHLYSDHLALASFAANGRLADASNSFLYIGATRGAGGEAPVATPSWAARKFNLHRRPRYRTALRLEHDGERATLFKEVATTGHAPPDPLLAHEADPACDYVLNAVSLSYRMLQALRRSDKAEAAFAICLEAWLEFVRRSAGLEETPHTLPGDYLDCIPANLLIVDDDTMQFVDAEWRWSEPVPLDWLIHRGMRSLWHAHAPWIREALGVATDEALTRKAAQLVGRAISRPRMRELRELESALQQRVNAVAARAEEPAEPVAASTRWDHAVRWLVETRGVRSIALAGTPPAAWREAIQRRGIDLRDLEQTEAADVVLVFEDAANDGGSGATDAILRAASAAGELIWCPAPGRELDGEDDTAPERTWLEPAGFVASTTDAGFAAAGARLWCREGRTRVTLVSPTSELHGGTLVIFRHAALLAERGHRVFIASLDASPPDWFDLPAGVHFLPLPEDPGRFESSLPDADALVATLWTTARRVAVAPACKGRKFYFVQSFESLWAGEPDDIDPTYTLPLEKLCVSSWLQTQIRETFDEASSLVLNGCDYAGAAPAAAGREEPGRLRIGMLYHEAEVKGTPDGLAAFARVRRELGDRVELVLYGTRRPSDAALEGVEFHDRPSRKALSALLRGLDLFLSPSLTEGFNLPALEAMSHGIPVVMTDCGGCGDYATVDTALLSAPGDRDELTANLLRACREPRLREHLAARGHEISTQFTWSRSADQMEAALGAGIRRADFPLHILYVAAGPVWFDTFLDPWLLRGLRSLGHEVTEFHPRPLDFRYAQRFVQPALLDDARRQALRDGDGHLPIELPDHVRRHRPDLVFVNHGLLIPAGVLDDLRRLGVPTAAWMMDEPQELAYSANRGRLFDSVFLQDRGSLNRHRKTGNPATFLMPHGADPTDHRRARDGDEQDGCDLLLIGTGFPSRRDLVRGLSGIDCDVRIIGRQWEGLEGSGLRIRNHAVTPEEAGRLYRSAKITLNVHRGAGDMASGDTIPDPETPNGSFFHIAACGSMQIVDREYPGAERYLQPDRQYVTFDNSADLAEKVAHYLEHENERQAIAHDAAAAVHGFQTYAHRLDEALRTAGRARTERRSFGLSPGAREDRDVFDVAGAVPLQSVLLHSSGDAQALQRSLLGIGAGQADPNEIVVAHPQDIGLERWLDQRVIPHVALRDATSVAAACNAGRRATEGEYLIYLSDEVVATTHLFRRLVAPMEREPTIGLVAPAVHPSSGGQAIDSDYRTLHEMGAVVRRLYLMHRGHFSDIDDVIPVCFAVRRTALDAVGGLDERFPGQTLEITDLCLRLRREGWRVGWTRSALVHQFDSAEPASPDRRREAELLLDSKQTLPVLQLR